MLSWICLLVLELAAISLPSVTAEVVIYVIGGLLTITVLIHYVRRTVRWRRCLSLWYPQRVSTSILHHGSMKASTSGKVTLEFMTLRDYQKNNHARSCVSNTNEKVPLDFDRNELPISVGSWQFASTTDTR